MTLSISAFRKMMLDIMTMDAMTLSIMTFDITLKICYTQLHDNQCYDTEQNIV